MIKFLKDRFFFWKGPIWFKLDHYIQTWFELFDAIITIISFGFIGSNFTYWWIYNSINRKKIK